MTTTVKHKYKIDTRASRAKYKAMPDPHFLVDAKLHDLRHADASRHTEKNKVQPLELAAIMGHRGLRMLKRYVHPNARELDNRMG